MTKHCCIETTNVDPERQGQQAAQGAARMLWWEEEKKVGRCVVFEHLWMAPVNEVRAGKAVNHWGHSPNIHAAVKGKGLWTGESEIIEQSEGICKVSR